jgi:DNA-binding Lrp family transcriptional regulator
VPPAVLARRQAAERAVGRLTQLGIIGEAVGQTARVLILGAWPCATGRFVNTTEVNYLSALRGRSTETVRRHVRELEREGWVRDVSLANGGRGAVQGVRYGIDVSTLIERSAEVEGEAEQRRKAERAKAEARALLRLLKGRLRRLLHGVCRAGGVLAEEVADLLSGIPRRFGKLALAAMWSMIDAAERLLGSAEAQEAVDNRQRGPTRMGDRAEDPVGPTDTQDDESICKGSAGEDQTEVSGAPRRETTRRGHPPAQPERGAEAGATAGATFDIGLREAMGLLPDGLRRDVEETYGGDGPRGLWLGLGDAASVVWQSAGGDEFTRGRMIAALGPQQGAVLLLLVAARIRTGTVRDVSAYAGGCTMRAVRGAFMWGAGLRSAVRKGRSPVLT